MKERERQRGGGGDEVEGSGWWVKKKETAKDGYGSVGAREDFNHFSFSQHLA